MNKEEMEFYLKDLKKNLIDYKFNRSIFVHEQWLEAIRFLEEENQQLKEQVENKYNKVGTLTNEILYEENTKLQQRIEKAIEYINGVYEMALYSNSFYIGKEEIDDLLEILKGEEK